MPGQRDRRIALDSPTSPARRSSVISLADKLRENPSITSPALAATGTAKRSPLAPLDLQIAPFQADPCGGDSSSTEDGLGPRKPSIPSPNMSRTNRYPQRSSARRPTSSGSARRSSLPSLHVQNSNAGPTPLNDVATGQDNDIYSDLSTYSFGAAHIPAPINSHIPSDDLESISPLQRVDQTTPRPSLALPAPSHHPNALGWSSASDDEDEEHRSSTRAKMRALDGGARRPSLPINEHGEPSSRSTQGKARRNFAAIPSSSSPVTDGESTGLDSDRLSLDFDTDSDAMTAEEYGHERSNSAGTFGMVRASPDDETPRDDGQTNRWVDSQGRRGSQPMAIPPTKPSGSSSSYTHNIMDRPDSHTMLSARRPSRSVDEDLMAVNVGKAVSRSSLRRGSTQAGVFPSSEPDMRGLAIAQAQEAARQQLEEQTVWGTSQAQVQGSPYEGLDLNYIFNASLSPLTFDGVAQDGSRLLNGRASGHSWTRGWDIANSRRQSAATVDDTFLKYVKKNDPLYDERKGEWSFSRERAEGQPANRGGSEQGSSEIWRCVWIGRYRIERTVHAYPDQTKPARIRLISKHIPDPFSKGYMRGGPTTFIHKHSRAKAFSLYRGYHVPDRHLKSEGSVLLAPRKIQEQFTSTRTTSKLSTHGLLEEHVVTPRPSEAQSVYTTAWSVQTTSRASPPFPREGGQGSSSRMPGHDDSSARDAGTDMKGKPKAVPVDGENGSTSSQNVASASTSRLSIAVSSSDATTDNSYHTALTSAATTQTSISPPKSTLSPKPSRSASRSGTSVQSNSSASSGSSRGLNRRGTLMAERQTSVPGWSRGSVGSLDDQPIVRTSHAEAFAVLDTSALEYYRSRGNNIESLQNALEGEPSTSSRFKVLRKLFQPQPVKTAPKHGMVPSGPHTAVLEANFSPPWVTLAKRDQQEEQERMIKNLNDSFRDVGLLPASRSARPRSTKPVHKVKRTTPMNVFAGVPDDSLFMLLPMWPAESDLGNLNIRFENYATCDIPVYDRQYLLVYYVPLPDRVVETTDKGKKRPRQQPTSSSRVVDDPAEHDRSTVSLKYFNILARLVSYKDVNGSGIRVPTHGLSITGPLGEAIDAIPQIHFQMDDLALILGFCDNRDRTVEFLPEGAEKLGLCMPRVNTEPDPDAPDLPLSPLGRSAVEMAWLGALAVMNMNGPRPS